MTETGWGLWTVRQGQSGDYELYDRDIVGTVDHMTGT